MERHTIVLNQMTSLIFIFFYVCDVIGIGSL